MSNDSISSIETKEKGSSKRPVKLPYSATKDNGLKLKEYLINNFPSVFKKSTPFNEMNCKPVPIHLKLDPVPHAVHVPIPIPMHWKDQVKAGKERDIADGILEAVSIGVPATWCFPMVVTAKNDRRPRRTVEL